MVDLKQEWMVVLSNILEFPYIHALNIKTEMITKAADGFIVVFNR